MVFKIADRAARHDVEHGLICFCGYVTNYWRGFHSYLSLLRRQVSTILDSNSNVPYVPYLLLKSQVCSIKTITKPSPFFYLNVQFLVALPLISLNCPSCCHCWNCQVAAFLFESPRCQLTRAALRSQLWCSWTKLRPCRSEPEPVIRDISYCKKHIDNYRYHNYYHNC